MADREKVINGLECCFGSKKVNVCGWQNGDFPECPYNDNTDGCIMRLSQDALSLLKAQEPKFVSDIAEAIIGCKPKVKVGHCPSCGVLMSETDRYCRECGQAVKCE
jgi:hypothetical protein